MSQESREELRFRIRADVAPPDASVVLRGGPDTVSLLRTHAHRMNRLYVLDGHPLFGVSVFVAHANTGPASEWSFLAGKLHGYATIHRTTVGYLTAAGFTLLPTFTDPHFTVVLPTLDAAPELAAAFGDLVQNPYAERREEDR